MAIIFVIYIQNGDILSKDLIINEFKCKKSCDCQSQLDDRGTLLKLEAMLQY